MTTTTIPEQVPTRTAPLEPGTGTPLEPTTPIRPSEAIRLGCLTTVQAFDDFGTRRSGMACALGAMNIGLGYRTNRPSTLSRFVGKPLPLTCPECGETDEYTVGHLNDDHRWSRERIADWLAELGL